MKITAAGFAVQPTILGISASSDRPIISVVVPVYRSQKTLPELCRRIHLALADIDPNYELILVEDCGGDDSWRVICELAERDARVRGIRLSRNFGQHAATICGFAQSRGQWVATLDDDLEQAPEFLADLFAKTSEGHDLIYGTYGARSHAHWRNVTSDVARWLFAKAIPSLNYEYTSFRMIRGELARKLQDFDSPFPFVDGYLSWLTNRCATVQIPHSSRVQGSSNYTFKKLLVHTINIFVTFSDLPLKAATWAGVTTFLVGMVWLLMIFGRYLLGGITVSGYASIMAAILFFGGIQLLVLGIFGEYLGRMNFKSSKKPLYLVATITWLESDT